MLALGGVALVAAAGSPSQARAAGDTVARGNVAANIAKDPAADFTNEFFSQIEDNTASSYEGTVNKENPPLMAFNGLAVIDSKAVWYHYIDPTLGKSHRFAAGLGPSDPKIYKEYLDDDGLHEWAPNKFIGQKVPVFKWDGHRWWIGVSFLTVPSYDGSGKSDINDLPQPVGQATDMNAWSWTVYDPAHVKLYQYTGKMYTPKIQPFFPLRAEYPNETTDDQPFIDHGILNDFLPANGWQKPPSSIAGWLDLHTDGRTYNLGYGDYAETDGGEFVTSEHMNQALHWTGVKKYDLPSDPNQVKEVMLHCASD